jgi:outer membrane protein assembly factor BamE
MNTFLKIKSKRSIVAVMAAIFVFSGCGAVRENKIRQEVLSDTALPEEIRRAIDQKELTVGMTKEQVIASWGLPCKWCYGTRKNPGGDMWEYHFPGADSVIVGSDFVGIGTGTYLYFDKDGKLRYWSSQ